MRTFSANLDKFTSTRFVAPIDDYELEVIRTGFKIVSYTDKHTKKEVKRPVVTVLLRIVKGETSGTEYADKPVTKEFWLDETREESFNDVLRFSMACFGIPPGTDAADAEFKQQYGDLDWSVDIEAGTLGSAFNKLVNARVRCNLSQKPNADGTNMYQQFAMFRPF